ncbi:ATP-binding cassette domain-containing protein [Albimonas sp. CAU 1670]|uniref:ATP-binding cassette domain-containing protein n=1 Tax=Albimonas sp. CAU 1670 TaxID=3032599 RepID=UPI0023DB2327|nr:ATP-binding cassette domain-containing protein [Albimonas sp. CAU 1670]MDF2231682.1 ATP-binding cassette domain-containing protein [Albimonas sp. CAU 1670]
MPDRPNIVPFPGARRVPPRAEAEPPPALEGVVVLRAGRRLLDGLTLRLPGRGATALLGPRGAGKSLALEVLAGLAAPDLGEVRALRPATALVPRGSVALRRSVRANLLHALRGVGVPRADRPGRLQELLALAALGPLADHPARELPPGEARRLAIARALASSPRLLLLDDPTRDLEPRAAAGVETLAAQCLAEGMALVIATPDPLQAARLSERCIFMHRGRDLETAPTPELLDRPRSDLVRAWLSGKLLT